MDVLVDSAARPSISVIIPIYNGESDLPELIACLQAQTYPVDRVEYLIVDNNSRDRTPELLKSIAQANTPPGWTLRHLTEAQIQSSYAARNTGIKAAHGEILAFTDADCRPQPRWLEHLIQPFNDPSLGANVGIVAGEIVALPGQTLLEEFADRQDTLSQKHTLAHPFYPYGQTANLAVRRHILEEVGLFRPYLTTGGDADLCWRIQQQSPWRIHFAAQATVQHRHRATLAELRRQWQRYGHSNRYLHELHGIDLMQELQPKEQVYRWSRWLLKEVPLQTIQILRKQDRPVSLLETPLGLICRQARTEGQQETQLPDEARYIDRLDQESAESPVDLLQ